MTVIEHVQQAVTDPAADGVRETGSGATREQVL